MTDASERVADLFRRPPPDADWRPILRLVARWAFGTLPAPLRRMYGVRSGPVRRTRLRAELLALRTVRPTIPRRFRWILPAQEARVRVPAA